MMILLNLESVFISSRHSIEFFPGMSYLMKTTSGIMAPSLVRYSIRSSPLEKHWDFTPILKSLKIFLKNIILPSSLSAAITFKYSLFIHHFRICGHALDLSSPGNDLMKLRRRNARCIFELGTQVGYAGIVQFMGNFCQTQFII